MKKGFFYRDGLFKRIYYKLPFGIQAYLTKFIFKPKFGEDMIISKGRKWYYGNVSFGKGTRIAADSFFSNISVGNYTVFAKNFRTLESVHCYDAFSIHSGIKSIIGVDAKSVTVPNSVEPRMEYYSQTLVGSDVWIGEYVTVKGGVSIGDGAVVAANSTVTHDVPPYAVVAGSPAKFIKWRLPQEQIDLMMEIKWWNWSKEKIAREYNRLCMFDQTLKKEI